MLLLLAQPIKSVLETQGAGDQGTQKSRDPGTHRHRDRKSQRPTDLGTHRHADLETQGPSGLVT